MSLCRPGRRELTQATSAWGSRDEEGGSLPPFWDPSRLYAALDKITTGGKAVCRPRQPLEGCPDHVRAWALEGEVEEGLEVVLLATGRPKESHSCFRLSPTTAVLAETPSSSWTLEVSGCCWDLSAVLEELTPFSMMEPGRGQWGLSYSQPSPMSRSGVKGKKSKKQTNKKALGTADSGGIFYLPGSLDCLFQLPCPGWWAAVAHGRHQLELSPGFLPTLSPGWKPGRAHKVTLPPVVPFLEPSHISEVSPHLLFQMAPQSSPFW